jgi:hypothetical protein
MRGNGEAGRNAERSRRGEFLKLLAGGIVVAVAGGGGRDKASAQENAAAVQAGDCGGLRVIQGRIAAIDGSVVTVKTPDGYPGGGPGMHAQFVTRGPEFRVDISAGRVLHPDGKQEDRQPLSVGERVVVVLNESSAGAGAQAANAPYAAVVVERVSTSDRMVTH